MQETKYILKETDEDFLSLKQIITEIKRYSRSILLFAILIALSVGTYTFFQKDYYSSSAIGTSSLFQGSEINPVIDIVSSVINTRSTQSISQMLKISEETAASIIGMKHENITFGEGQQYIFKLNITTTDSTKIDEIFESILKSVESNQYLANKFKVKSNDLDTLILKTSQQITDLNKLKAETLSLSTEKNSGVIIFPTNIYAEIVSLEERLLKLKNQAQDISIVEYIQRPPKPENPAGPKRLITVILSFIVAIALGFFAVIGRLIF